MVFIVRRPFENQRTYELRYGQASGASFFWPLRKYVAAFIIPTMGKPSSHGNANRTRPMRTFTADPSTWERLDALAEEHGLTASAVLELAILHAPRKKIQQTA